MDRTRRNVFIYFLMLLLFGVLIYLALGSRDRFLEPEATPLYPTESALGMFISMLTENLVHPLTMLFIQIIAVLLVVRLFGYICKYIGQPGVIGEILAGIVLGPSVLGVLFPEAFGFLFRAESLTNLGLVSELGLVLFMFVIGMEVDFSVLKNKIHETLVISHAGILVPFFLGIVASYWVYEEYASGYTAFLPFSLFMGISMSITAFPVLARIVQERNMTREPAGILAIASAANDDVTAWCLLAIVIAVAKAGTFTSAMYVVGLTLLYIIGMFTLVRPFLKRVGEVYANQEVINKTFVSFIFLILIVSATVTEILGIHALFGAFIAGVIMPPNLTFRKIMTEKVEDVSLVFFLPLFFAYTGLRTEIGLINTPELAGVCMLLIVVAVAGKFGGCAVAARIVGESRRDSYVIGSLMNTRGLMELVALNIGYEMGILPPSIFVLLIIMALVTTFMTTPLLNLEKVFFRKKEQVQVPERKLILSFGNPETGKHLLEVCRLLFGNQLRHQNIIAAHYTVGTDVNPAMAQHYYQESFAPLDRTALLLDVDITRKYRVTDHPVSEIISLAARENPDLLLVGAGHNFMRFSGKRRFSLISFLSLFRKKIGDIIANVSSPVAIFVNRNEERERYLSFLVGREKDGFLLKFMEMVLKNSNAPVYLYFLQGVSPESFSGFRELVKHYPNRIYLSLVRDAGEADAFHPDRLLVLSYEMCEELARRWELFRALPSLLVIRDKI